MLQPSIRDWPEDAGHENGNYECRCINCGAHFTGHKRRVFCRLCAPVGEKITPDKPAEWNTHKRAFCADG